MEITLLKQSLRIKKSGEVIIIDSSTKITDKFNNLGLGFEDGTYRINAVNLQNGNKDLQLRISTSFKTWTWDIIIREPQKIFAITYRSFKNKVLSQIFISVDYLKYGMRLSTHFGKSSRIIDISAHYKEMMKNDKGNTYSRPVKLYNPYFYTYKRNNKLDTKKMLGELKLCDCD